MSSKNVPIKLGDHDVLGSEFSNIRERFDAEMKKMEDEMTRFRNEVIHRESLSPQQSALSNSHQQTVSSSRTQQTQQQLPGSGSAAGRQLAPLPQQVSWIDSLNSPLVQDTSDGKQLQLRFDVSQYSPEEIVVKTVDNKLLVHAKHEEKTDCRSVFREYNREFLLPHGCNPEHIKSSLSKDRVLTVCAPLPAAPAAEASIPITHQ